MTYLGLVEQVRAWLGKVTAAQDENLWKSLGDLATLTAYRPVGNQVSINGSLAVAQALPNPYAASATGTTTALSYLAGLSNSSQPQTATQVLAQQRHQQNVLAIQAAMAAALAPPTTYGGPSSPGSLVQTGPQRAVAPDPVSDPYLAANDFCTELEEHLGLTDGAVGALPVRAYMLWVAIRAARKDGEAWADMDRRLHELAGMAYVPPVELVAQAEPVGAAPFYAISFLTSNPSDLYLLEPDNGATARTIDEAALNIAGYLDLHSTGKRTQADWSAVWAAASLLPYDLQVLALKSTRDPHAMLAAAVAALVRVQASAPHRGIVTLTHVAGVDAGAPRYVPEATADLWRQYGYDWERLYEMAWKKMPGYGTAPWRDRLAEAEIERGPIPDNRWAAVNITQRMVGLPDMTDA